MSSSYYLQPRSSSVVPSASYSQLPRTSSFGNLATSGLSRTRSTATVFSPNTRSYLPGSYYTPSSYNRYSVVGSTPRTSDRYPFVRYSTVPYATQRYAYTPNTSLLDYSLSADSRRRERSSWSFGGNRSVASAYGTKSSYLEYGSKLRVSPYYGASVERPRLPTRNYVKFMDIDDAVDLYKNRFLTSNALSKYWLSPKKKW